MAKEILQEIIENVKRSGYKLTKVRHTLIEFLFSQAKPLSAPEILQKIQKKHYSTNKTTIYRELEFLCSQKIAEEVTLGDGIKRYEIPLSHHHHLVCLQCRKVSDVSFQNDIEAYERRISRSNGFKIFRHSLEFFGICVDCQ